MKVVQCSLNDCFTENVQPRVVNKINWGSTENLIKSFCNGARFLRKTELQSRAMFLFRGQQHFIIISWNILL